MSIETVGLQYIPHRQKPFENIELLIILAEKGFWHLKKGNMDQDNFL